MKKILIPGIFIFLVLTSFTLAQRVTNGLSVLYNFNEGSGTTINDASSNGIPLNLTIDNTDLTSWTAYGLNIHGNARIKSNDVASKLIDSCKNTNELTFEAWLLPSNINTRKLHTRILTISKNDIHERDFGIIQYKANNYYVLRTNETSLEGKVTTFDTISADLTHLVFTRKADGTIKTFRNGNLVLTDTITGDFSNWDNTYSIFLGNESGSNYYWEGTYYLVALYNRALTDSEVVKNYNEGVASDNVPFFAVSPKDQYVFEGETATFNALAVSIYPVTYQWKKDGEDIAGATSKTLTLQTSSLDDGSTITCVATSSAGSEESSSATLYVSASNQRIIAGQKVLYKFREHAGNKIFDNSNVGSALNFTIYTPGAVEWVKDGLMINSNSSILSTTPATKVIDACKNTQEVTIEAWVKAANKTQTGPARIFTLSADENSRDFSLSQDADSFEVRLRATSTSDNGLPALSTPPNSVSTTDFDHIVYTRDSDGNVVFYVNNSIKKTAVVGGDLSNWESSFFAIGNELGGIDLHWEGTINLLAVFDRALTQAEVARNYSYGPIGIIAAPTNLSLISNELYKVTFTWEDNANKESGYIIERGEGSPLTYTIVDTVAADEVSYTDTTFSNNKLYTYRVKAFNINGESDYSNTLEVLTKIIPVVAPTNLAYTIHPTSGYPQLTWDDNSDNELGFIIERRGNKVGDVFESVDTVNTNATSFMDETVDDSTVYDYRVYAYKADTVSEFSNEIRVEVLTGVETENVIPKKYSLAQNYPNPFNPTTKISFGLPEKAQVSLKIFNLLGQEVLTILNKELTAGNHSISFNAGNLTSGVYIYTISAKGINGKNFTNTKKMILMK